MAKTLAGIALPNGLVWADEFAWTAVEQESERSLAGTLHLYEGVKSYGRPITLAGAEDAAWVDRATLLALYALTTTADQDMTLIWHERTFTVRWDFQRGAIEAPLVMREGIPTDDTLYSLTLRLLEVPTPDE